jgi:hypothetical protein
MPRWPRLSLLPGASVWGRTAVLDLRDDGGIHRWTAGLDGADRLAEPRLIVVMVGWLARLSRKATVGRAEHWWLRLGHLWLRSLLRWELGSIGRPDLQRLDDVPVEVNELQSSVTHESSLPSTALGAHLPRHRDLDPAWLAFPVTGREQRLGCGASLGEQLGAGGADVGEACRQP